MAENFKGICADWFPPKTLMALCQMPFFAYMGLMCSLSLGRFLAKSIAPAKHMEPPITSVPGAPILLAAYPASKLPNGAMPMNDIV